jgi:hypothetical protein
MNPVSKTIEPKEMYCERLTTLSSAAAFISPECSFSSKMRERPKSRGISPVVT